MSLRRQSMGRTSTLIIGDTLALLLFSALGRAEHQLDLALSGIIGTTAPFWIVWLIVGNLLGTFKPEAVSGPGTALRRVIAPWLITLPWAVILRAFVLDGVGGTVHVLFSLVTLVTVYGFLAAWRVIYALWLRRKARR